MFHNFIQYVNYAEVTSPIQLNEIVVEYLQHPFVSYKGSSLN